MNHISLDIQYANENDASCGEQLIKNAVNECLKNHKKPVSLCVRLVDKSEMQQLNNVYRGIDKPTNVLSFEAEWPEEIDEVYLGDIVICGAVVEREAQEQGKSLSAHWLHMVIHGVLHLLGMDHQNDTDAAEMELLETTILLRMGYEAPY